MEAVARRVFRVPASAISVLSSPSEFYERLVFNAENARERVSYLSLYAGNGPKERKLAESLYRSPAERVVVVFDEARARRDTPHSTIDLFTEVCGDEGFVWKEEGKRVVSTVSLPHHRDSFAARLLGRVARSGLRPKGERNRGDEDLPWAESLLPAPARLLESMGVFHIKSYAADDVVIWSGANMSADYFENRQDRYVEINNSSVASAAHDLAAYFSTPQGRELQRTESGGGVGGDSSLPPSSSSSSASSSSSSSVEVRLVPQFRAGGVEDDWKATLDGVRSLGYGDEMSIATGYFAMPVALQEAVIAAAKRGSAIRVITASPKANGFLGAKGPPGHLPTLYSRRLGKFARKLQQHNVLAPPEAPESYGKVSLYEWERKGWTFHAKGAWILQQDDGKEDTKGEGGERVSIPSSSSTGPFQSGLLSSVWVGSPNLGNRSFAKDVDLQVQLGWDKREKEVHGLMKQFCEERDAIWKWGKRVGVDVDKKAKEVERKRKGDGGGEYLLFDIGGNLVYGAFEYCFGAFL